MVEFIDYYEVLQVHPKADQEVIDKAYKTLIFKHHPDRGGDPEVAKRLTCAYYVLGNPERRSEYDRAQADAVESPGQSSPVERAYSVDQIPQATIDEILSRAWLEGAAATVRDAGRKVAAGVAEVAAGASELYECLPLVQRSRERGRRIAADEQAIGTPSGREQFIADVLEARQRVSTMGRIPAITWLREQHYHLGLAEAVAYVDGKREP